MPDLLWFVLRRLLATVLVMLALSLAVYLIFYAIPADPARLGCGKPCTPDRLEQARHFMQLDQSVIQQYLAFLRGIVAGRTFGEGSAAVQCDAPCFGYSFPLARSVTTLIVDRLPVTASIAIGAAVLWLLLGVSLGVGAALKRGKLFDRVAVGFALIGIAAPSFLLGLLAILVFGSWLNMVPVNGYVPLTESPVDWAWHLITPWLVLAAIQAAAYIRLTRAQMLEEMNLDHITTARAKGAGERRVVAIHGLRGVLVPIVTIFGLDLGALLGGAILTEKVFSMQGLGELLISAVAQLDVAVVVGVTLFSAFLVILANLVVDVMHGVLDPRVGHA
ncbi:peptide/nickel transport system permease protein [Kribbella orskensis]|uniref:Peptide/nickel transport system permease protein n=1 Tax=Kribbella orskensis TaxID=2512216 RepID=A0ABY2B8Y9_9ACTN|nr:MULTISPECIES: ABC transporter permease [Kribbella]TCN31088.1 peptide/nickel transport system permease protein [Kribbella sp. VKM Ac-2500]TCO11623.1 peptide/nickel transport system permease protein [Kribbella orskensis]